LSAGSGDFPVAIAGLGQTNVSFALSNSPLGGYSVEVFTNLADWQLLGPATPRYLFTDTNAPAARSAITGSTIPDQDEPRGSRIGFGSPSNLMAGIAPLNLAPPNTVHLTAML
jgi:hypothetical protein